MSPSERNYSRKRRRRDHAHYQESTGKSRVGDCAGTGPQRPIAHPYTQGGDIVALFFLSAKEKARLREAEHARQNRAEIIQAWSQGQVTRRDLVKWGLIT